MSTDSDTSYDIVRDIRDYLPKEIIRDILDYVAADLDKLVNVDKRAYLSQESFRAPPPQSQNQVVDIANFRLTCRLFSELGIPHQFSRITTRFSVGDFERLEAISEQPHLTQHVKKFSYMVPCFYSEGDLQPLSLQLLLLDSVSRLDANNMLRKLHDQRQIVQSEEDVRVLRKAFTSFHALQHVQILRVQDADDAKLLALFRRRAIPNLSFQLPWASACLHSARTIGLALADAASPIQRFSSPMLHPQSAVDLAEHPPRLFFTFAQRLTCLELHFEDGTDLDIRMQQLSSAFRAAFAAAVNLEAIHVGFPSHRPLSLPLESIFHHICWEKLIAFGIQGWRLDSAEIVALARRHRYKLKGLRLRDVLLKEGSMWKDVLSFLRDEMTRLDWVSLRRVGYAKYFDQYWENAGVEVPDDPPGGLSDSEDEEDELYETDFDHHDDLVNRSDSDEETSDSEADHSDDEHGPQAYRMDFPPLRSPVIPTPTWCTCNGRDSVEDLGDDGISVDNTKRKSWEQWVLHRCPEHSRRD